MQSMPVIGLFCFLTRFPFQSGKPGIHFHRGIPRRTNELTVVCSLTVAFTRYRVPSASGFSYL